MDVNDLPVVQWSTSVPLAPSCLPQNIRPPVNQGECGACWAVASASVLADRKGLSLNKETLDDITHNSTNCVQYGFARGCNADCSGGYMVGGMCYAHEQGLLVGGVRHRSGPVYRVNLYDTFGVTNKAYVDNPHLSLGQLQRSADNIAREVQHRGTVCATFNMFSNFVDFWRTEPSSRIFRMCYPAMDCKRRFKDTQGSKTWSEDGRKGPSGTYFITAHSIVLVGFGEEDGQKFWICRNSWGTAPNRPDGTFRIARGENMCGIESDVLACSVDDTKLQSVAGQYKITHVRPTDVPIKIAVIVLLVLAIGLIVAYKRRLISLPTF